MTNDEKYMQRALSLAKIAASHGEVPVGAVVVLDGEIIGEGWNQPITLKDPTAHAEIVALRAAAQQLSNYRLPEATLYVTIEPCTMCAGALVHSRIARLVYGASEPKSGVAASNGCLFEATYFNHQIEICASVLAKECSDIMSEFFKQKRLKAKADKKIKHQKIDGSHQL
jgi:tRNA(adenine34) deaminase